MPNDPVQGRADKWRYRQDNPTTLWEDLRDPKLLGIVAFVVFLIAAAVFFR